MTCGVKLNWKTLVRAIYKLSKYKKDKRDERDEAMAFLIMILQFPKRIRFSHIRDNFIKQYEPDSKPFVTDKFENNLVHSRGLIICHYGRKI